VEIFIQLPHTADIKIRVFGDDKNKLFEHAVIGMFQVLGPHAQGCSVKNGILTCPVLPRSHVIELQAGDLESLLVDFLSQVWWFSDVYNEAYLDAEVQLMSDTHLKATVHGIEIEGFDVVEIKAVTYHDLSIQYIHGRWQADIVFDI
jgi:SHS2 domain-containing protein